MPKVDMAISLEDGIGLYDDAGHRARERLESVGLAIPVSLPRHPSTGATFKGRVPSNLSELSSREVGMYYNLQEAFVNYVSWQLAEAQAEYMSIEKQHKLTEAAVRRTKAGSVAAKKDETIVDHRLVEKDSELLEAKLYVEYLTNIETAGRRTLKAISRIIELHKMQLESGRRGEGIRKYGKR